MANHADRPVRGGGHGAAVGAHGPYDRRPDPRAVGRRRAGSASHQGTCRNTGLFLPVGRDRASISVVARHDGGVVPAARRNREFCR